MPSPVLPDTIKNLLPNSEGNQCDNFMAALLAIPTRIWQILNWMFASDGSASLAFHREIVPSGDLIFSASPLAESTSRMLCNGRAIDRTTYAALFAAIGTTYGAGDGSTTFNIPDFQARFPVGVGTSNDADGVTNGTYELGDTGGEKSHSLTSAENGPHTHNLNISTAGGVGVGIVTNALLPALQPMALSSGSGTAHENRPPYLACYIYIAL